MSTLNCKLGDLAIVVKSYAGNEGKIVRCEKFVPHYRSKGISGPAWVVSTPMVDSCGARWDRPFIFDAQLRPIRPLDELDDVTRDNEVTA